MRKCLMLIFLSLIAASSLLLSSCNDSNYDQDAAFSNIKTQMKLEDERANLLKPIYIDQIAKVKTILEAAKNRTPGERPNFQGEKPSFQKEQSGQNRPENPMVAELATVTKEAEAKLTSILSAQQIEEYNSLLKKELDKILESNKPKNGPGQGEGGPPSGRPGPGGMPGGQRPNW